nr:MAG TPA: hypothetical protein [Bacteriophage sp.]
MDLPHIAAWLLITTELYAAASSNSHSLRRPKAFCLASIVIVFSDVTFALGRINWKYSSSPVISDLAKVSPIT